jgi:hypothetical protein
MWDSPFNNFFLPVSVDALQPQQLHIILQVHIVGQSLFSFFPVSVDALQPHIILLLSGDSLVQTTGILFI